MKVFICYRRKDSQPFADRIYDWLERAFEPDNIFKDIDTIPLGRDFRRILEEAVVRCEALLVVIGPRWLGETDESGRRRVDDPGDWVRIEIETALERDIPVIPLLVDGASFPREEDLPPSLQKLVYRHGTPVRPDPDFRHDMGRVIKALRGVAGGKLLRDEPASRHPERSAPVSETTTPSVKEATPPPAVEAPAPVKEATPPHCRQAIGRMIMALREIVLRVSRTSPTEAVRDDERKPRDVTLQGRLDAMGLMIKALRDEPASRHPERSAPVSETTTPSVKEATPPPAVEAPAPVKEATPPHFRQAIGRMIMALREIVLRVSRTSPTEAVRDDERKPQSWWTTLPGILTAAAGIMTALTGLVVMLNQVGAFPRALQPAPTKAFADSGKAIGLDPKLAAAYNGRDDARKAKQEYGKAIDSGKAIELDPKDAKAYLNRGYTWYHWQAYDKAIADYDKAIELGPKLAAAYNGRGNAWYVKQAYDKAIADYDKAIELDPKLAAAYTNRDLARKHKQEYDKAIELDPKDAKAYLNRGNTWYHWQEYDKAIADYDKAIELDPKLAAAYTNRDDARKAKQEYGKAIDSGKAIELDPKDAKAYLNRGYTWYHWQEYDKAIADYDKAIELDPKLAAAYFNRGNTWYHWQKYDKAIADYDKAIELDPKLAAAYLNRDDAREAKQGLPK